MMLWEILAELKDNNGSSEDFYKDFPLKSIIPILVEDFIRMEFFHRKDNFGDLDGIGPFNDSDRINHSISPTGNKLYSKSIILSSAFSISASFSFKSGEINLSQLVKVCFLSHLYSSLTSPTCPLDTSI